MLTDPHTPLTTGRGLRLYAALLLAHRQNCLFELGKNKNKSQSFLSPCPAVEEQGLQKLMKITHLSFSEFCACSLFAEQAVLVASFSLRV